MKEKVKEMLNHYHKVYGKFTIASKNSYGFWKYMIYPSQESEWFVEYDEVSDRYIFKDEIVIETDLPMRKMNKGVAERIERKLLENNFAYTKWFSGNKSYHFHLTFPELTCINKINDLSLLKRLFIRWIYSCNKEIWNCSQCSGKIWHNGKYKKCNLLGHKVDLLLCSKHLIRMEHSHNDTTGNRKVLLSECIKDEINIIPEEVWDTFNNLNKFNVITSMRYKKASSKMKCIEYLYNNTITDCRHRVIFILYNNLKEQHGINKAKDMIHKYNSIILNSYIRYSTIYSLIESGNRSKKCPKCNYIKEVIRELGKIEICDNCEYNRGGKNSKAKSKG